MTSPTGEPASSARPHDVPPNPDLDTDPGRGHPYESLYRGGTGGSGRPLRPNPRHWEPSLQPPDGEHEGFGWLYRDDPDQASPAPSLHPPPPEPPVLGTPAGTTSAAETRQRPIVRAVSAPTGEVRGSSARRSRSVRRRTGRGALVVLLVLLVAVVAVVAVDVRISRRPAHVQGAAPPSATATPPSTPVPAPIAPQTAMVSCQAPPATDDAGRPVSYLPANLYDGDPGTAWRCPGAASGQTVTFTFPRPVTIVRVGLINGYAKVDPTSRVHRYHEYRRIIKATWTFAEGTAIDQTLTDGVESIQQIDVPAQTTARVTLTVDSVTEPGSRAGTRNAVLISETAFAAVS
jgi:hypothetical protein